MIVNVLNSGSKGNCTYVEIGNLNLLIDAGISYLKIKNYLRNLGKDLKNIEMVLITHTHYDHINGLASLIKKEPQMVVYTIKECAIELTKIIPSNRVKIIEGEMTNGEVLIKVIKTSHDVPSCGYLLEEQNNSIVYITDTGYINRKYLELLRNKKIYVIEANHDEKMLWDGPYPYTLKQRVSSDIGHLSNTYTGKFLANILGKNTEYILLAHLSEQNNTPELALKQVKQELEKTCFNTKNIIITKYYECTEMVEIR